MKAATRRLVRARAGYRCEYCRIHEDDEAIAFHLEHIIASKHGGNDQPGNLAWSCQHCNLRKASDLAGRILGKIVPLYNPRRHSWRRHFRWDGPILAGKSKTGRATIQVLDINAEDRVELRAVLITFGRFPPEPS